MDTPVALFLFNRPEPTRRVFERIVQLRPKRLFLVADGPRNVDEAGRCAAARAVVERVDWPCEVRRNFADANLGCGRRMASGIDWVFEHAEEAILLEDDCVPEPSFFPYCEELLARYRDDERVWMICGANLQFGRNATPHSYHFASIPLVWGWATWRRAWRRYDVTMKEWPALRDAGWLRQTLGGGDEKLLRLYTGMFDQVHDGRVDTWDFQWNFAMWRHGGLAIHPGVNLISNVGFGTDATHTKAEQSRYAGLGTEPIAYPLTHPPAVVRHVGAERFIFDQLLGRQ
jgi:hypothetical protein